MLKPSTDVDQKSSETEFPIAIRRPVGNKWQSKMLFLAIFDPHSSIVKRVFDCSLPGVISLLHQQGLRVSFICIVVGQGNPTRGPE